MKLHSRTGQPIDEQHWLGLLTYYGVGVVLSETHLPSLLGDLTIRTVWLGVTSEAGTVKPFRTLRQVAGRSWTSLEEYEDEAGARAGHVRWCVRAMGAETE